MSDNTSHQVSIERQASGHHRYPWRAVCCCGWASRGYVRRHAAAIMRDEHLDNGC